MIPITKTQEHIINIGFFDAMLRNHYGQINLSFEDFVPIELTYTHFLSMQKWQTQKYEKMVVLWLIKIHDSSIYVGFFPQKSQ